MTAAQAHDILLEGRVEEAERKGLPQFLATCIEKEQRGKCLEHVAKSRSIEMLHMVARHMNLCPSADQSIVQFAAKEGLHDWMEPLTKLGFDISLPDPNDPNQTVLEIAASADDLPTFKQAWAQPSVKRILEDRQKSANLTGHCLVTAILHGAVHIRKFLQPLCEDVAMQVVGTELCKSVDAKPKDISVALSLGIVFSSDDLTSAAAFSRPSVVKHLLSRVGASSKLRLDMFSAAVEMSRYDNAFIVYKELDNTGNIPDTEMERMNLMSQAMEQFSRIVLKPRQMSSLPTANKATIDAIAEVEKLCGQFLDVDQKTPLPFPHLLAICGLLKCIPDSVNLLFVDDDGLRVFDYAGCQVNSDAMMDFLRKRHLPVHEALSPKLLDLAVKLGQKDELKDFLFKLLEDQQLVGDNVASLACVLHYFLDLQISESEWSKISDIASVKNNLAPIAAHQRDTGLTLLMSVAGGCHSTTLLESMLNAGVVARTLLLQDKKGRTCLHHLLEDLPVYTSADQRHAASITMRHAVATEKARLLLGLEPALAKKCDREKRTPFILAARCGAVPILTLLLSHWPIQVLHSAFNTEGMHAIHVAASSGSVAVLKHLVLERRIPVNLLTKSTVKGEKGALAGDTPLHCAARAEQYDAFELLIDLGANPFIQNGLSETPLQFVVKYGKASLWQLAKLLPATWHLAFEGDLLVDACRNVHGDPSMAEWLARFIDPNQAKRDRFGAGPLEAACHASNEKCASLMLQYGAKLLYCDEDGQNALHYSVLSAPSVPCAMLLLQHAQAQLAWDESEKFVVAADKNGDTAMHLAARAGYSDLVYALLSHQSIRRHMGLKNKSGLTAANSAALAGHRSVALLCAQAEAESEGQAPCSSDVSTWRMDHHDDLKRFWEGVDNSEGKAVVRREFGGLPLAVYRPDNARACRESDVSVTPEDYRLAQSGLSQEHLDILETHPALANKLTKSVVAEALLSCKSHLPVVQKLLDLVKEKTAQQVTSVFCRTCFPWVPVEDWPKLVSTIEIIAQRWNQHLPEDSERHPIWQWLQVFTSLRSVDIVRPKSFYDELDEFATLVAPYLRHLPVPQLPNPNQQPATNILSTILRILRQVEDIATQISHLNCVPYDLGEFFPNKPLVSHYDMFDVNKSCRWKLSGQAIYYRSLFFFAPLRSKVRRTWIKK